MYVLWIKLIVLGIVTSTFAFDIFVPIHVNIFVWLINTAVIRSSIQSQLDDFIILSVSLSSITLLHDGTFSKNFRKYILTITKVGGAVLLLTGIAILTGQLQVLGFFILEYFPSLGNIG